MKIGKFEFSNAQWVIFGIVGLVVLIFIIQFVQQIFIIIAVIVGLIVLNRILNILNKPKTFNSPEEESAYRKKQAELHAEKDYRDEIKRKKETTSDILNFLGGYPPKHRKRKY